MTKQGLKMTKAERVELVDLAREPKDSGKWVATQTCVIKRREKHVSNFICDLTLLSL